MICDCPLSKALEDIPVSECPENFGQIQKVAFQIVDKEHNFFDQTAGVTEEIEYLAAWERYIVAKDSKKIVLSPYLQAPTTEGGEAITFGGGNETPDGISSVIGIQPTTFNGLFRGVSQNVIEALKKLSCYQLGVYLFNENGQIGCSLEDAGEIVYPIPINSLFIGDKVFGGLEAPDTNTISWQFAEGWSDTFHIFTPNFNPLTDLESIIIPRNVSKVNEGTPTGEKSAEGVGGEPRGKAAQNK